MSENIENGKMIQVVSEDGKRYASFSHLLVREMDLLWGINLVEMFKKTLDSLKDSAKDGEYVFDTDKTVKDGKVTSFSFIVKARED